MTLRKFSDVRVAASIAAFFLAAVAAATLAGCGGGDDSSSTMPTTYTIAGTVTTSTGTVYSGAVVRFDNSTTQSATTNSQGAYSLTVTPTSTSGNSLWVYDSSGNLLAVQSLTLGSSATVTATVTVSTSPPSLPTGFTAGR